MKPSEKFPKGFVFTPKYMMRGMNNMEWIDWKKVQTDKVADRNVTPYQMRDAFRKGT